MCHADFCCTLAAFRFPVPLACLGRKKTSEMQRTPEVPKKNQIFIPPLLAGDGSPTPCERPPAWPAPRRSIRRQSMERRPVFASPKSFVRFPRQGLDFLSGIAWHFLVLGLSGSLHN